ncbi:MAG: type II toxin-antitoxin system VapC family toxin [Terriglobia bacterium]|jgi:predicted nucleic acid-binding protein
MIVADSDVLIDYLRRRQPGAAAVVEALRRGQLHTTILNCFELLAGAQSSQPEESVLALLESLSILPLDFEAARKAAEISRELDRLGVGIGLGDILIAGIVLAQGGTLLAGNRRHFERVPGLSLANLQP